jgi:predicted O-linked N-acetylglucosamine transferase (SPINDLY family)
MPSIELSRNSHSPSLDERCDDAMKLQVAGRLDAAEGIYREILRAQPLHAAANYCLGIIFVHLKRPGDSVPHLLTALSESPQVPDYWLGCLEALLLLDETAKAGNLLASARQNGLAGAAIEEFAKRLEAKRRASTPAAATKSAAAESVASADIQPTRPASAPASRSAKTSSPRQQEKQIETMMIQGRFGDASALARTLTERYPKRGYGWKALGALLAGQKDVQGALVAMARAVELMPRDTEALRNMGVTYYELERYDESERYLRRALEVDPHSAAVHNDLGVTLSAQSRVGEARTHYRRAIALSAHESTANCDLSRSNLLLGLSYDPTVDAELLFAEHCRVGEHLERQSRASPPGHSNNRDADRRLQVGFVSGDFCNHSVANFIEPILARLHNYQSVELHAYYNHHLEDAVTSRLRGYTQHWRSVFKLSDQELVQQIRDDGIDILIDLSGHTTLNRLRTFAGKPAPIQASWIGYPGTTGMRAMDYYLTDRHFLPPGQFDRHFTEKLVYLPANVPFRAFDSAPPVNALPALASGRLTFASFNRIVKINATTVDLWSKLLHAVPTAELLIAGMPQNYPQDQLAAQFSAAGVARERIAFHPRCGMETYLGLHRHVDVCLDTYPYNGGTTTVHAIWMGVPTLTMVGPTPAGRQGAAMLGQLDLDGFVAGSAEEFVANGRYWAENLAALATVRAQLRSRWELSPARNPDVIVAGLEQALRRMWKRWCANLPPESF